MSENDSDTIESDGDSWKELRKKRLEIDNNQCSNCGSGGILQVHHVVPESLGGVDEVSNLRTLCVECHNKAHNRAIGIVKGHYRDSNTRWLPTVDTMGWFLEQINHPTDRAVVMLLAKTGIGVQELASLELNDIYLNSGGLGLTSTVERSTHPFILLAESESGPGPGISERLCDTLVPIDPELRECILKALAIRPDSMSNKLLLSTRSEWGEPIGGWNSVHR